LRLLSLVAGLVFATSAVSAEPLPSWNDGASRQAIVSFVEKVTKPGGEGFVAPAERIAVFDNDGTLWSEQPLYVQLVFALDRVKKLAPQHPEWKDQEPFRSVLGGDIPGVLKSGKKGLLELVMASHAGMTTEEFASISGAWLERTRHPKYGKRYTECIYAPISRCWSG
jgi:hypothetical protein